LFNSLQARLTVWYLFFFTLLLLGFSVFIYALLSRSLRHQLDTSLSSTAESAVGLFRTESLDRGGVEIGANRALLEWKGSSTPLAIFEGPHLLGWSDPRLRELPDLAELVKKSDTAGRTTLSTIRSFSGSDSRVVVVPVEIERNKCLVVAIASLDPVDIQLVSFQRIIFLALPLPLVVAALGGFLVAGRSLSPLTAISRQADVITASNLHTRLDIPRAKDDLGRLVTVINRLLSRLDQSFAAMRGFVADASHELRTPLAIIRAETDVSLSQDRSRAEYKESLGTIQDETGHLTRLVDDLLNLARADAGHQPLQEEEFYLNDTLEECFRAVQPLARSKNIKLDIVCQSDVAFRGDQELIRRMISNLLDNATRYTPEGGSIVASIDVESAIAHLKISDTGIGIPEEYTDRVFERFFRVDKARSRADGGYGLGLSIVKWVAEAHRGSVQLSTRVDEGCTFTVSLPLGDPALKVPLSEPN
jgi:two-component system, OmpR family, sensor kinase